MESHLDSFTRIKEWTDLGNWLQKTATNLEKYPTQNIPHRKKLAKRLSQCLNESLPIGIHRTTLNIYTIIFEQIKSDKDLLCKNIPIYSFGLFPFFPRSSIQVKPAILKIFRDYYLILGLEMVPLLSGLISSLLPGLEEQDTNLQNSIFDLLNDINQIVGDKFFVSNLWFVLLKNSKNRLNCLKVLFKKFSNKQELRICFEKEDSDLNIQTIKNSIDNEKINVDVEGFIKEKIENEGVIDISENNKKNNETYLIDNNETQENIFGTDIELSEEIEKKTDIITNENDKSDLINNEDEQSKKINNESEIKEIEPNQNELLHQDEEEKENDLLESVKIDIKNTNNSALGFYPNAFMIINCLSECLEDEELMVKKNCLDFMIKNIPLKNRSLFKEEHMIILCESLLKLFKKNDLSVIKRFFLLMFNEQNIENFHVNQNNQEMIDFLIKAFEKLLNKELKSIEDCKQPFKIFHTVKENNILLYQILLKNCAKELLYYSYFYGYHTESSYFTTAVVEEIKYFIEDIDNFTKDFVDSFCDKLEKESDLNIYFLEFIVKVFLINSKLDLSSKVDCITNLMKLIFKECSKNEFKKELTNENKENFDLFFYFIKESTLTIQLIANSKNELLHTDVYSKIEKVRDTLTQIIKDIIVSNKNNPSIIENIIDYFIVIMKLDIVIRNKRDEFLEEIDEEEKLTLWIKYIFEFISDEYEIISYQSLRFLYGAFFKEKVFSKIRDFVFYKKEHYEKNKVCWIILEKTIDLLEISSFRPILLNYISRFIFYNIKFISDYLLHLLEKKTAFEFRKVSLLWKCTAKTKNDDFQLVLKDTVIKMLGFIRFNDPLIRSYFKDWLLESQNNFSIILNFVFKELINYTEWVKVDKRVYYNKDFNVDDFFNTLDNLDIILEYGKVNFLHYMNNINIPEYFEVCNTEIDEMLSNSLHLNNNSIYVLFFVKILVRYLVGHLNTEVCKNEQILAHQKRIVEVKEKILIFIERLLSSLNNVELVASISLKLIPICVDALEEALNLNLTTLQLEYINLMEYLIFKTKITEMSSKNSEIAELLKNPKFLNTFLTGLKSKHSFVIDEFSGFLKQLYFIMGVYYKHPLLTQMVRNIIFSFLENIKDRSNSMKSLKQQEILKEQIAILLNGLDNCIQFFLQVDEIEEKISRGNFEKAFLTVFTLGIVRTEEEIKKKISFLKDEETCKHLINNFEFIFENILICWNNVKLIRNHHIYSKYKFSEHYLNELNPEDIDSLSFRVINIIRPLINNFMERTIEALLQNWIKNNELININGLYEKETYLPNVKIMELILYLDISPLRLLFSLLNSKEIKNVKALERYEKCKKKKKLIILKDALIYEVSILSFLYSYLKYVDIDEKKSFEICGLILNILKNFEDTTTPLTLMWIFELINLIVGKMRQMIYTNSKLKSDWFFFTKEIFIKIVKVISQETIIVYSVEEKESSVIFPLNPSVYDWIKINKEKILTKSCKNEKELILGFDFFKENKMHDLRNRYFLILTMLQNSVDVFNIFFISSNRSLYSPNKIRIVVERIFDLFRHKKEHEGIIMEESSLFLMELANKNPDFLKEFKKDICEIFERDDFFDVNIETLKIWSRLIDKLLDITKIDITKDYFEM